MKITKTASGKYKLRKQAWESIGKQAGWMKKAQVAPVAQQAQQAQPAQQAQQAQPVAGQALTNALDPKMRTLFNQTLIGTGLSKQKVLPFLEQLFTALGDVPISKITNVIKILTAEETQQVQPIAQPVQMAPDQGDTQQETQTMVPQSG